MTTEWTPHEFQVRAICEMVGKKGFGLFAQPGLGKTSTTLGAFSVLKANGKAKAMLVVAPLRPAYKVWPNEIAKWSDFAGLTYSIIHSDKSDAPRRRREALAKKADIYLINYEGLAWLEEETKGMKELPFDVLCLDESQKIKNSQSLRFKVCKRLRDRFSRVWELTGTPAPNGLENLFGQIYMLDGGQRLGQFVTHFRREFFVEYPQRGGYSLWEPRRGAQQEIESRIADVTLALNAKDYLNLPELIENRIEVELDKAAWKVYKGIEDEFFAQLSSGVVTAANAAAKSMKLRQVVGGGVYGTEGAQHVHDVKVDALLDLIEEQQGQPLLVAVSFTHEVERIRKALGYDAPYLGGGISVAKSNAIVDDWNAGKVPVLLAHPTSVAHGLNLQAGGNAMAWFSLTWSQEEHEQMVARVYRQGQKKAVTIHYIVAADTIDDYVLGVLRDKTNLQASLMTALKRR